MSEMSDLFDSLDIGDLDEIAGKLNVAPKKAPEPQVVVEEVEAPVVKEKKRKYVKFESLNKEVEDLFENYVPTVDTVIPEPPKKRKVAVKKEPVNNRLMEGASRAISHTMKNKPKFEAKPLREQQSVEERIKLLEQDVFRVQAQATPNTLVAGIGASLDSGGGAVWLWDLDDVNIGAPVNGQYPTIGDGSPLVFDATLKQWVAGAPDVGGDADELVSSIKPGVGIDVAGTIPPGKGDVTIALDASINDLNDVDTSTVSEGQTLLYSGGSWGTGGVTTAQVDLTNPAGNPFSAVLNYPRYNSITPQNVYTTQEDANQLFGALINDLDDRVEVIENSTKPGTFLGMLDVTEAANEPDNSTLNQGDYFIHDGASGPLWGTGDNVDDGDSVIWNEATWVIIATTTTLNQLGDVNISNPISDQMLVYDDSNDRWYNESVTIPKVFIDTVMPAGQGEKDGDFWLKNDENILHVYDSIWTEVSGAGGGGASFGSTPPTDNDPGDLWIDTDDYNMYAWDGEQWFDLTGGAGGDAAFVTLGELNDTVDTVNFNINQVQNNLGAAVLGLDNTHLRITPQTPLAGTLTLSSDLTFDGSANQIISVDNAKSLKIKGADDNGNSRTFIDVQNADSSGSEGANDGYRVKMYHVADPTADHHVANKKYVDEQTGSGVPVGSIMMWINANAPTGWLKLKGASFDINTYPLLHAYLQQSDGYVSGKLPDWQGHYPGQLGDHLSGSVGGMHTQRTAEPSGGSPKSSHKFNDGHTDSANKAGGTNYADTPTREVVIDTGWDSVTRPPTIAVHFIIKHD